MALLSQADVGSALQIFFNLQTLPEVCKSPSLQSVNPVMCAREY